MASRQTSHGLTPREREMISRYEDQGQDFATIAAEMGLKVTTVEKTCRYFTTGLAPNKKHRQSMTLGSAALSAAIQAARGF